MYEEQARINATISYFFLGPIFLLVRNSGPLTDPYVRLHAKRASIIMAFGLVGYITYFLLSPFLVLAPFGSLISTLSLGGITTIMVGYLIFSAYKAFHGDALAEGFAPGTDTSFLLYTDAHTKTDTEKVRIIASLIPLLGIWISSKYNDNLILIGRKVGTFFFLLIISSSLFLDGSTGLSLILILLGIILIAFSWVSLFMTGSFPIFIFYKWIPSYHELKCSIKAGFLWFISILKVLSGSDNAKKYSEIYNEELSHTHEEMYLEPFIVSPHIIAIPLLNLITFPFIFQKKYSEYRSVILQGFLLTILFILIWFFKGFGSDLQLFLLIPMIHLISFAHISPSTQAPGVDIMVALGSLFGLGKEKLDAVKAKEESVSYSYTSETEQ